MVWENLFQAHSAATFIIFAFEICAFHAGWRTVKKLPHPRISINFSFCIYICYAGVLNCVQRALWLWESSFIHSRTQAVLHTLCRSSLQATGWKIVIPVTSSIQHQQQWKQEYCETDKRTLRNIYI